MMLGEEGRGLVRSWKDQLNEIMERFDIDYLLDLEHHENIYKKLQDLHDKIEIELFDDAIKRTAAYRDRKSLNKQEGTSSC